MKKIEFEVVKGEHFSMLEKHSRIDMPIRRFLSNNIEIDVIDTGEKMTEFNIKKEVAKNNYKITVTIETT